MTTVLIVDDVRPMAEQYAYDLKRISGCDTLVAFDGDDALATLSRDIVDCVVLHFAGDGILLQPSTNSKVSIANTIASVNGITGININPLGSAQLKATVERTTTNENQYGARSQTHYGVARSVRRRV